MQQPETCDRFLNIYLPLRDLVDKCVKDGQRERCALDAREGQHREISSESISGL